MAGQQLRSVTRAGEPAARATFPFSVPAVRALGTLEFPSAVTFSVGENGSGKSTVLEGIAAAAGLPAVGSADIRRDATLEAARTLGNAFRLTWEKGRTRRGFFLRAEDFFGFTKQLAKDRAELEQELAELPAKYEGRGARTAAPRAIPMEGRVRRLAEG